ncbi:hypothetical protein OJF2_79440 (plasmid) [Aquisphaera giovannonii]|uniref:Uncharacterized protein n=1 Tax=Aquisphaera giovannonii TaxID=406548 RepID=A0A5B9WGE8_9BACT|nr:hypothetical protein [Aquisphaera giovannonii]QEH39329.1 hypothetical protein OJF2_79440 [Aquisphaera giovannonii]
MAWTIGPKKCPACDGQHPLSGHEQHHLSYSCPEKWVRVRVRGLDSDRATYSPDRPPDEVTAVDEFWR